MIIAKVKEDTVSLRIRMFCLSLLITSAAKLKPIWSGGSEVDCSINDVGISFTAENG